MTPKRVYFVLLGIIVLLVVAIIAGTFGVNSLLSTKSTQLVGLKAKLAGLNYEQVNLSRAKKDIVTYTNLYDIARSVVPENKDQAQAVRQIANLAANSNINLESISFPSSTIGGSGLAPPASSTAPAVPVAPAASSSSSIALSQLVQVPTIPGVYELPITVSSSPDPTQLASYPQLISFLSSLEKNRLTALVSSINITPNTQGNLVSFTLTLAIYVKPS